MAPDNDVLGLSQVVVHKSELLNVLKANMEKHTADVAAAEAAYKVALISELTEKLEQAQAGNNVSLAFTVCQPPSFVSEYARLIRMLEMSLSETVRLHEHEFRQYVLDEWAWKQVFAATVTSNAARIKGRA